MSAGPLIAINIIFLYAILGPMVILGIYVLFDSLSHVSPEPKTSRDTRPQDPALWTRQDLEILFRQA